MIINKKTKKIILISDEELGIDHPLNSTDIERIKEFCAENFSAVIPKNRKMAIIGWLAEDIIDGNWTAVKEKTEMLSSILNNEIDAEDYDSVDDIFFVNEAYRVLYA